MNTRERLHIPCGSIVPREEKKTPDQEMLEEKGGIFSCGGVYLPPALTPSPRKPSYDCLFLPNFRRNVILYKNLEAIGATEQEMDVNQGSLAEAGTSHEALRKIFREGLN